MYDAGAAATTSTCAAGDEVVGCSCDCVRAGINNDGVLVSTTMNDAARTCTGSCFCNDALGCTSPPAGDETYSALCVARCLDLA